MGVKYRNRRSKLSHETSSCLVIGGVGGREPGDVLAHDGIVDFLTLGHEILFRGPDPKTGHQVTNWL